MRISTTFVLLGIVQTDEFPLMVSLPQGLHQAVPWKAPPILESGLKNIARHGLWDTVCRACSLIRNLGFNALLSLFPSTLVLTLRSFSCYLSLSLPRVQNPVPLQSTPHSCLLFPFSFIPWLGWILNSSWPALNSGHSLAAVGKSRGSSQWTWCNEMRFTKMQEHLDQSQEDIKLLSVWAIQS